MAEVEVDKVLRLCATGRKLSAGLQAPNNFEARDEGRSRRTVGYEAAKVAAHNAVPGGTLPLVELWQSFVSWLILPPSFVEGTHRSLDVLGDILPPKVSVPCP